MGGLGAGEAPSEPRPCHLRSCSYLPGEGGTSGLQSLQSGRALPSCFYTEPQFPTSVQCRLERSQGSPAARKPEDALFRSRSAIFPSCVSFSLCVPLLKAVGVGGMQPSGSAMGTVLALSPCPLREIRLQDPGACG